MPVKKRKGSSLAMVIIIMAVLAILGAALLSVSLAESRQASWQDRKTQAHYIARSGVYVGVEMINKLVGTSKYPDLTTLKQALDIELPKLSLTERTIGTTGYFTLSFEITSLGKLKVTSTGNTGGSQNVTDVVTMDMDITSPSANETNPDGWVTGDSNLSHQANATDDSYIKYVVSLTGKNNCIKAPQGGTDNPVYQASAIKFLNNLNSGFSIEQLQEVASTTFDAQILYFESKVLLNNKYDAVSKKNSVYLTVSDTVLQNWMLPNGSFIDIKSDPIDKQGFASSTGYGDFIQGFNDDLFAANNLTGRYGIVYFGGPICRTTSGQNYVELYNGGWYFFKSGTNLHTAVVGVDLIPINSNDAVIKAVLNMLSFSGGASNQMWDNK